MENFDSDCYYTPHKIMISITVWYLSTLFELDVFDIYCTWESWLWNLVWDLLQHFLEDSIVVRKCLRKLISQRRCTFHRQWWHSSRYWHPHGGNQEKICCIAGLHFTDNEDTGPDTDIRMVETKETFAA